MASCRTCAEGIEVGGAGGWQDLHWCSRCGEGEGLVGGGLGSIAYCNEELISRRFGRRFACRYNGEGDIMPLNLFTILYPSFG